MKNFITITKLVIIPALFVLTLIPKSYWLAGVMSIVYIFALIQEKINRK